MKTTTQPKKNSFYVLTVCMIISIVLMTPYFVSIMLLLSILIGNHMPMLFSDYNIAVSFLLINAIFATLNVYVIGVGLWYIIIKSTKHEDLKK